MGPCRRATIVPADEASISHTALREHEARGCTVLSSQHDVSNMRRTTSTTWTRDDKQPASQLLAALDVAQRSGWRVE